MLTIKYTENKNWEHSYIIGVCWESAVGMATRYGLEGPGIETRGGEIFRTRSHRPWGLYSFLYNGYRVLPRGKAAGAWR